MAFGMKLVFSGGEVSGCRYEVGGSLGESGV